MMIQIHLRNSTAIVLEVSMPAGLHDCAVPSGAAALATMQERHVPTVAATVDLS